MKKILLISTSAAHGGGPFHIEQILSRLKERFEFFVACPDERPYKAKFESLIGQDHIFIIPANTFSISHLLSLKRFVLKNKINIIHSHGKGAGIYSRFLNIGYNARVIHTFHGLHFRKYSLFKKNFYLKLESILANLTNTFISVSESEKADAMKYFNIEEHKIKVIYNGVKKSKNKAYFPEDNKDFTVLWMARFDPVKDPYMALDIAEDLKDSNIRFIFAGDGELFKSTIKRSEKLSSNIEFPGFIDDPFRLLSSSNVFLSTSKWEGLPYSMLSAQSAGLPCIATNVSGHKDIIDNDLNGFLFDNPSEAVNKILSLKNDKTLWEKLSENSIKISNEKFSVESMIEKLTDEYIST